MHSFYDQMRTCVNINIRRGVFWCMHGGLCSCVCICARFSKDSCLVWCTHSHPASPSMLSDPLLHCVHCHIIYRRIHNDFTPNKHPTPLIFLQTVQMWLRLGTYRIMCRPSCSLHEKSLNFKQLHRNENESHVKINITFPWLPMLFKK